MLKESLRQKANEGRTIEDKEREIVLALLGAERVSMLPSAVIVRMMDDGGMGSIEILMGVAGLRKFGKTLSMASCIDLDGVEISIVLNVDMEGRLFELDIWKVDFSPLISYLDPKKMRISYK